MKVTSKKKMKVLNLYACLGGNRLLWKDCEVTAVELDPELARMYQERFPNDKVIITDAHQYLLEHYKEFDFIWSSPPYPSHSRSRYWNSSSYETSTNAIYPDLKLYEEILFLKHYFKGKFVVENVVPYYKPLIQGKKIGRHLFWSNFVISELKTGASNITEGNIKHWENHHQIEINSYKGIQRKDKILRNLVHFDTGLHVFNLAKGIYIDNNIEQGKLF